MFTITSCFDILLAMSVILPISISILKLCYRGENVKRNGELYHDIDGTTTRDAQVAFVRRSRYQVIAILIVSFSGLIVNSTAVIVIETALHHASERLQLLVIGLKIGAAVSWPLLLPKSLQSLTSSRFHSFFKAL